ncbi:MAG TPA: hypothetical protein VFA10_11480 [Ktedonobacteraceae bacterium]|nr:hypothetical protein [Ktedonobacteraceae bacterium]
MALSFNKYPHNWRKVSRVIRRIAGYCCEQCGQPSHSVHHVGAPYADGRPGNPHDKHDIRRENLLSLCFECHDRADNGALSFYAALQARGKSKRARHRALGVGCGLVPVRPVRATSFHWYAISRLHYALLRWTKRTGCNQFRLLASAATRIVDSSLVEIV